MKINTISSYLLSIILLTMFIENDCSAEKIKIGVSIPLTGPAATYGTDLKNVLEFANFRTGSKYELVYEDDKCNAKEAVNIANKFIYRDKLKYVTGYACSSALMATASLYERAKVLTIGLIAVSSNLTDAGDYIFRTYPSNEKTAGVLADYIFKQHTEIAVISEEDEFAQSFLKTVLNRASERNALVDNLEFNAQTSDLKSLLFKLKSKKPAALLINISNEKNLINILMQIKQLNWQLPIYNAFFAASPTILKQHSALVENVILVDSPWPESLDCKDCLQIYQEFKKQKGGMLSIESVFISAYNGFHALDRAIQAQLKGQDPKDFLYQNTFNGILGRWGFDRNGDVQDFKFVIKSIKKSKSVITTE